MESNGHLTIVLGKDSYKVSVPHSFADREDVVAAWSKAGDSVSRSKRAYAMTIGICVPTVAKLAKADYAKLGCDDLIFGAAVYDYLRSAGVSAADITVAATACFHVCYDGLFPREEEVKSKEVFTDPTGALPT